MTNRSPTNETYGSLLKAYDHFNLYLFESKLPSVLFTYHRQNRVMGYASFKRWINHNNEYVDEIAINPEYFAKFPIIEIFQTLVHEMVHIWQAHFGKPGRRNYHNKEWAKKMESIGLIPSSTGKPGGDKTGESIMDYVSLGGRFFEASNDLLSSGFTIPLLDRYPVFRLETDVIAYDDKGTATSLDGKLKKNSPPIETSQNLKSALETDVDALMQAITDDFSKPEEPSNIDFSTRPKAKSGRVKYVCKGCQTFIWAKRGLNIGCLDCESKFFEED